MYKDKDEAFCSVTPCCLPAGYKSFEEMYCILLQGKRITTINTQCARIKAKKYMGCSGDTDREHVFVPAQNSADRTTVKSTHYSKNHFVPHVFLMLFIFCDFSLKSSVRQIRNSRFLLACLQTNVLSPALLSRGLKAEFRRQEITVLYTWCASANTRLVAIPSPRKLFNQNILITESNLLFILFPNFLVWCSLLHLIFM